MAEIEYLSVEDLLRLTRALGAGPVRDVGLLDAAAARVRSTVFGEEAYPALDQKAAALLHSLAKNHPLVDGNKRLCLLAALVFLDLNGHETGLGDNEAFRLVMDVAAGHLEVDDIAGRLQIRPR